MRKNYRDYKVTLLKHYLTTKIILAMKQFKFLFLIGIFAMAMAACGGQAKTEEAPAVEATEAAPHGANAAHTSAYVCPMHCEGSGSDAPGTCPVCNMAYVAQAEHTTDGHTH